MDEKTKKFIERAVSKHGHKYDYSQSIYIGMRGLLKIVCPIHGEFTQTAGNHIYHKHGCQKCGNNEQGRKLSKEMEHFLERAKKVHGDKYTYENTIYRGVRQTVIVTCPIHGIFNIFPCNLYRGSGCKFCNNQHTTESFIEAAIKIHGDQYNYSLAQYSNSYTKIIIICKKHGNFQQEPGMHLFGQGCPSCKTSKGEKRIVQWLIKQDIEFIPQFKINQSIDDPDNNTGHGYDGMPEIKNLRFDFYLPYYDLFIEFDGAQHEKAVDYFGGEETLAKIQENDAIKNEFCERCHLDLLRINHRDFDKIEQILDAKIKKKKEQGY